MADVPLRSDYPIELLTSAAAARLLGLAQITLAKWRCAGGGPPFIKLGSRVLYPAGELRAWVAAQPRFLSTTDAEETLRRPLSRSA